MPLAEADRGRLDGIVSQMQANGENDADIQHVVGDFKTKYDSDAPSMGGSFGRGALRSAAPTLLGGFMGGAASSAAAGAELGPIGVAGAGLIGGIVGMVGASEAQKKLATAINPSVDNPFSEASEQRDVQANPFSSEAGGLLMFKPNPMNVLKALRGVGTAEGRQLVAKGYQLQKAMLAAPEAERAALSATPEAKQALDAFHQTVNVAGNTGVGAGMGIAQGQDPEHILLAAAQGSLFNDSWLHSGAGHPLDNPKDAQVHADLDKVAQADAELARKTTVAAEIINQGAENPLTTNAAHAAAEVLGEKLPQEEAKQKAEITEALKPLAESKPEETFSAPESEVEPLTPPENAPPEVIQPESLQTQPEGGTESPQAEETGSGDSVLNPAQSEKIVSATFTDENGQVHEGQNHLEAAKKAGVEAPNSRKSRETDEYGFMAEDADGNRRVVTRREALKIAKDNSQLKAGARVSRNKLHSDQVDFAPETPVEASEPSSVTETLAEASSAPEATETPKETVPEDRPRSARVPEQYMAKELGLPAHMSDKGSVHHRQIERAIYENKPVHAGEAKRYGVELPKHFQVGKDGIARPVGKPEIEPSRLSASSDPVGESPKTVTQAHVSRALEALRRTPLGRKLLKAANVVPDWQRTVAHPDNKGREFSGNEINTIKQAQGFYDPQTGKTFVIRDNIQVKPGETPEQAVIRVLMHERAGHDGMGFMRANDPEFEKAYHDIAGQIPKEELDSVAQRYGYDPIQDRDRIIGEWFARNVEDLKPGELPDPKSVFGKMWQAIKDFINRLTGKETATDQQVRDLASAILHSDEALEPRTGGQGEVETRASINPSLMSDIKDKVKSAWEDIRDLRNVARNAPKNTDRSKAINEAQAIVQTEAKRTYDRVKEIRKVAKDKVTDEALNLYREAKGDIPTLGKWAKDTDKLNPEFSKAADRATSLSAEEKAMAEKVTDFYDDRAQHLVAEGHLGEEVLDNGSDSYFNRMYQRPKTDKERGQFSDYQGKLAKSFIFSRKRSYPTTFDAVMAGLKPKTIRASETYPIYAMHGAKVEATNKFIKGILSGKASDGNPLAVIKGADITQDPEDGPKMLDATQAKRIEDVAGDRVNYKDLNDPRLTGWKFVLPSTPKMDISGIGKVPILGMPGGKGLLMKGNLAFHPEAFTHVKNWLGSSAIKEWYNEPSMSLTGALARKSVKLADSLNSGIKGGMFGLSPFHIVQEGTHGLGHLINPLKTSDVDVGSPKVQKAMRNGLMLFDSTGDSTHFMEGLTGGSWTHKIPGIGKYAEAVSDLTFQKVIPSLKMRSYEAAMKRNMERFKPELASGKITEDDVGYITARDINNGFGHLNYRDMGRNPTVQHLMRLGLLAPDFLEARTRFALDAAKGLTGAKVGREQAMALSVLGIGFYIAARALNAALNNGDTKPDHPFSVVVNDREYSMRSVPEDIWKLIEDPRRFGMGRISPIARTAVQEATGRNYRGEKVGDAETLKEFALMGIPLSLQHIPGISQLTETAKNSPVSPLESSLSALGLHVGKSSPINETYKLVQSFNRERGKEDTGTYPSSPYTPLKNALEDQNYVKAHDEIQKLRKGSTLEKLTKSLKESLFHAWTGSKDSDEKFRRSLSLEDRAKVLAAERTRQSIWKRFQRLTGQTL